MRSLAKFTRIFPLLFLLLFSCQTEDEPFMENDQEQLEIENFIADAETLFLDPHARIADDQALCVDAMEIPLMHMRYIQVGNVTVANSEDLLYVKYETNPGYFVDKTMLVIVVEKKININGKKLFDKTKYKKYLYSLNHDPGSTNFTYELPINDLKLKSECLSIIAIAKVRKSSPINNRRSMYSFARNEEMQRSDRFHGFMIDYCIQDCTVEKLPCDVACTFGFGMPSVDMSDSYSFRDLKLDDWPWGYVHEINDETMFRLPIKSEDSESGEVVGQVTVMIEDNIAYVYFQLNDGYPMYSSRVYLSGEFPDSGVPCEYNFSQDYTDVAGNWKPTLTSTHIIDDVTSLLGANGSLKIIAYVDFCE